MNISFLRLGWTNLRRDWRAGQLRLLLLAVTLAVATLTAVSFFADRLNRGMQRDALQLLGGDAVVVSDQPTPTALQALAARHGLRVSASLGFPTMARTPDAEGGSTRLVALKAVEAGYPLRGRLTASTNEGVAPVATSDIPAPGEVWVDPGLLDALGTRVGSELLLGEARLRITRVIGVEPDRGGGFINFAPRVLMNRADLAATQLVQPASRVNYRYAVAATDGSGNEAAVRRFVAQAKAWIEAEHARGTRIEALDGGRPELSNTLERAEKFLQLVALLAALLSAVAVGLAARAFANAHLDSCAMLRVLGLAQATIARAHALEFLLVGLGGGLLGAALGWAAHHVFVLLLAGLVDAALPAPGLWPVGFGLGVGLTLMAAFGLPPVLQLARVPALRVIRRDVGEPRPLSLGVLALGLAGFAALLLAASRDWTLGLITVGGFAVAVALFAAAAWGAVAVLRRVVREDRAPRWLILATRQLSARPVYAVLQVSSLAIGLLALLLLALLRTDLIDSWRKATPVNAPNRFVINIQPDQAQSFQDALARAGVAADHDWYPMVRGRLVAVNDRPVQASDYQDDRAQRLVEREFNLSYSAQPRAQPHRCGAMDERRPERHQHGRRHRQNAGPEARRPPALRHRGPAARNHDHLAARGGLGFHACQFLRPLSREQHAGPASDVLGGLPRARRQQPFRQPARARVSQRHRGGPEHDPGAGAAGAGPGQPRRGVPVRLHARGGADRAVCRRGLDAGRTRA